MNGFVTAALAGLVRLIIVGGLVALLVSSVLGETAGIAAGAVIGGLSALKGFLESDVRHRAERRDMAARTPDDARLYRSGRGRLVSLTGSREETGQFVFTPASLRFVSDDDKAWALPLSPTTEWLVWDGQVIVNFNGLLSTEWLSPSLVILDSNFEAWGDYLTGHGVRHQPESA